MTSLWRYIPVITAVAAVLAVGVWVAANPAGSLQPREGVAGGRPPVSDAVEWPGEFLAATGPESPTDIQGMWPSFRGENRDGVSPEEVTLVRSWPKEGPKQSWTTTVGIGYAGPAIANGRVFLMDYDESKEADTLRCLSLNDGRELWRRGYHIPIDSDHGISRTVPAVSWNAVVTLGPKLHVMCVDSSTGSFKWGLDMAKTYKTAYPKWYAGQCPLIDRDRLILAPAGAEVLMVALDMATGQPVWTAPNLNGWTMTHSSITPMDYDGKRMYLYCASGGITAVAGEDDDGRGVKAGDILWERDDWKVPFANVPSPVILGGGHILLSGGYGGGAMLLKLTDDGATLSTEVVWRTTSAKDFGAEQQTPIFYNGYIYAVLPKDVGSPLVCIDSTGRHVWESGRDYSFGLGPYLIADGLIFAMNDSGLLTMIEATPDAFKPLAQAQVFGVGKPAGSEEASGQETWAPMAFAGGRLLVRDLTRLICLDLSAPPKKE
jgi:outer membrane protein assembly factor BamB